MSNGHAVLVPLEAIDPERIERTLAHHSYDQMAFGAGGSTLAALLFTVGASWGERGFRIWTWVALQLGAVAICIAVYAAYRRGRLDASVGRMRSARRAGVIAIGIAWGIGGMLWPIRPEFGPGFALVFCYAGICAGAATTLAADPLAYVLLGTLTLFADVVLASPSLWWVSALLVTYHVLMSQAVFRNHAALRESLSLRFENAALLRETIAEREAAIAARTAAERAAESRTRFLAAASHDLRQPMQALSLFVDVLERDPDQPLVDRMRTIASLSQTTEAMRAMLTGLLDLSRLDAGTVKPAPRPTALAPLLDEVVSALRDEAESYDMVVHVAGRTATVDADPAMLSRILHNLATNAVRHARRGRVLIAVRHRGGEIVIQVWDQGPGIEEADQTRIFEEFVQLGNQERDRRRGLGLGLAMVRRLCEHHGYGLTLRSTPGRGSMFAISVPLTTRAPETRTTRSDATTLPFRVLLVEDDVLVSSALSKYLESFGCTVHAASDGSSALALHAELARAGTSPDVIVTDERLPGAIPGAEIIRRIEASGVAVRAVLLTGDVQVPRIDPRDRDVRVLLRKPATGEALLAAIEQVLVAPARA